MINILIKLTLTQANCTLLPFQFKSHSVQDLKVVLFCSLSHAYKRSLDLHSNMPSTTPPPCLDEGIDKAVDLKAKTSLQA